MVGPTTALASPSGGRSDGPLPLSGAPLSASVVGQGEPKKKPLWPLPGLGRGKRCRPRLRAIALNALGGPPPDPCRSPSPGGVTHPDAPEASAGESDGSGRLRGRGARILGSADWQV